MENGKIYDLVKESFSRLENRLIDIDKRMRDVEQTLSESKGKASGLITIKDGVIILCALGALILSFIRLNQG